MATYIHLPNSSGIYQIVNKTTQKRYIGYASSMRTRVRWHIRDLKGGVHRNSYLQNAWNVYGEDDFESSVLQVCNKNMLCFWEDYWVRVLNVNDRYFGYNIKPTDPLTGRKLQSKETKEKLSKAHKALGTRPSELCLERIREYYRNGMSNEHKKAQQDGLKKVDWKTLRQDKAKKVLDINSNIIYPSVVELKKATGLTTSTAYRLLNNKLKRGPINRHSKYNLIYIN